MLDIKDCSGCEKVFSFFEEFSAIPHGSGNTAMIADYLVKFAKDRGLSYSRDEKDNVIISKPATKGYEDRPAIIFQGHLDMVAAKTPDADIDMEKEGLTLFRDGDFIRAKNTTLGGDDGVALAYALAILDSDSIAHPHFEAIFTSDEEIGLLGANALCTDGIKGRLLINIDSDEEGIFTVGCAGGMRSDIKLPISRESYAGNAYRFAISGLKGGHSGIEIDKGRVNGIKALAEVLKMLDIRLVSINGGAADNAIPYECEAVVICKEDLTESAEKAIAQVIEKYKGIEDGISIKLTKIDAAKAALTEESSSTVIALINGLPSGVIAMSKDIEGLVQTSLNLGIVDTSEGDVSISFSVRSAVGSEKRELGSTLRAFADKVGASYSERGDYPAWEYRKDSHLRDCMKQVYTQMYGVEPKIVTIHAGLECGILSEKIEGLDCVSIGPNNYDIHTTEERLSISSTIRVWEFLLNVLKSI